MLNADRDGAQRDKPSPGPSQTVAVPAQQCATAKAIEEDPLSDAPPTGAAANAGGVSPSAFQTVAVPAPKCPAAKVIDDDSLSDLPLAGASAGADGVSPTSTASAPAESQADVEGSEASQGAQGMPIANEDGVKSGKPSPSDIQTVAVPALQRAAAKVIDDDPLSDVPLTGAAAGADGAPPTCTASAPAESQANADGPAAPQGAQGTPYASGSGVQRDEPSPNAFQTVAVPALQCAAAKVIVDEPPSDVPLSGAAAGSGVGSPMRVASTPAESQADVIGFEAPQCVQGMPIASENGVKRDEPSPIATQTVAGPALQCAAAKAIGDDPMSGMPITDAAQEPDWLARDRQATDALSRASGAGHEGAGRKRKLFNAMAALDRVLLDGTLGDDSDTNGLKLLAVIQRHYDDGQLDVAEILISTLARGLSDAAVARLNLVQARPS